MNRSTPDFYSQARYYHSRGVNQRRTIPANRTHQNTGLDEAQEAVSQTLHSPDSQNNELNRQLISFNYVSGHDLQEPLRKIRTFSSRLLEKEFHRLSDHGKEYAKRLNRCAEKMQSIIQDLTAFARLDLEQESLQQVCLDELVAQVTDKLMPVIREKKARILYRRLGTASVLPSQFCDLLYNILHNAIKFSHPDRPLRLIIRSRITRNRNGTAAPGPAKRYRHLSFEDNGIGFEQKYSEKIFDIFQRLHGHDEFQGNGIGLSICRKVVMNHHGHISARSEPDRGTIFDVYIPIATS
jgi:light-regulated signal transduction histidine kinase (bacteriophytochrome)